MSVLAGLPVALALIRHSIRQVLTNRGDALRLSALPWLGGAALGFGVIWSLPLWTEPGREAALLGLLALLPMAAASFWFAIAWHRFVLCNERGQGFVPPWHGRNMLGYAGHSIGLMLVGVLAVVAVGLVLLPVNIWLLPKLWPDAFRSMPARRLAAEAAQLPGLVLALWLGLRMGLVLPAAALGMNATLRGSWQATREVGGALIWLALAGVLLNRVVGHLAAGPGAGPAAHVFGFAAGWATLLLSVSLLTTLYGHVIERRPLN